MAFVSGREKRLWGVALLVILTIYSTLGVVEDWLQPIQNSGWSTEIFLSGCFLIFVFVVTQGMNAVPGWKEIIIALIAGVVYLIVLRNIDFPEERMHIIMYGVVALLIHAALLERFATRSRNLVSAVIVIAVTACLGTIDELIQMMLPSRVSDVRDIEYNVLAAIMAVSTNTLLRWARG